MDLQKDSELQLKDIKTPFIQNNRLRKLIINYIKRSKGKNENIFGNLAMNSQQTALDLFEYIVNNYKVNWNFECYGSYSIFELWQRSFKRMDYDVNDLFYKRFDMIDKKFDILDFAVNNGCFKKDEIFELYVPEAVAVPNEELLLSANILSLSS